MLQRRPAAPLPIDHTSALPPEVVRALRLVAAELRDMPRDCARDREELVHWLARLARRLDAVVASKARAPAETRLTASTAPPQRPPAVTGDTRCAAPTPSPKPAKTLPPRSLPARTAPATRWRARRVDPALRHRVEAAGQLVLPV